MFQLAWPLLLLLLPLPLLARLLPRAAAPGGALRVPFFDALAAGAGGRGWRGAAALLVWLLLLAAAARPQWLGEPLSAPLSGRDLLLAVDLSGSMRKVDMRLDGRRVSRLEALQAIGGEFIRRRHGDRVGLILFGSRAYLQAPLSFDRATVAALLAEAEPLLAGKETAIGDAIGLAVKRLRAAPGPLNPQRVLVLLTDGAHNAGALSPQQAAELARDLGLTIYTVGVGGDSGGLDEAALRAIAAATGGRYFRAADSAGLEAIYRTLDQIEPVALDARRYRPVAELYPWPLGAALLLSALAALPRPARRAGRRTPGADGPSSARRRSVNAADAC